MHTDLERVASEDEAARAGVEAARSRAHARVEAVRAELAREREKRLHERQQEVDAAVARILAEGEREVQRRQALREARSRDDAARTAGLVDRGADLWTQIVRKGSPGGSP